MKILDKTEKPPVRRESPKDRKLFRKMINALVNTKPQRKNRFLKTRIETDGIIYTAKFGITESHKTPKSRIENNKSISYVIGKIPIEYRFMGIDIAEFGKNEYMRINIENGNSKWEGCAEIAVVQKINSNIEDGHGSHKILYNIMDIGALKGLREIGITHIGEHAQDGWVRRNIDTQIKIAEEEYRNNLREITNDAGFAISTSLRKKEGIYGYTYMQVLISAQESMMGETNMFPT